MKTPMQELIEQLKQERELILKLGGLNERDLIEDCIKYAESMLDKEKDVMCEFTLKFTSPEGPSYINKYGSIVSEEPIEEWYDKQFNTREK
jgi:hypothetical protein